MVRALASHQCGPGLIPRHGDICGLNLLLVLVFALRVFLRVLRFSSLHKNQHFRLIPIRSGIHGPTSLKLQSSLCLNKGNLFYLFILSFAGEAAHLAADFDYVCESEFPAAQLAERQYRQHAEPSQQQSRKNAIIAAKYVLLCQLNKIQFIHTLDRSGLYQNT